MLEINKDKKNTTVLVAMSGGVDSSTVAAMLKLDGYNVVGVTLKLYSKQCATKSKTCCGDRDIFDAKKVATKFSIKHYVLDYESIFKQDVVNRFVDEYLHGSTPVPCIRCNQSVKFRDLLKVAKEINADAMVTGHYVRRIANNNIAEMHRAIDEKKDQSYFLFSITQEQLNFLHFPLGNYTKEKVRQIAKEIGVEVNDKPDSQDICFIPDGDYTKFIRESTSIKFKSGNIVNVENNDILGQHNGLIGYTRGQRRGIGISWPNPLYVIKTDFLTNTLFVGEEKYLYNTEFIIEEVNLLDVKLDENNEIEANFCIRALQPLLSGCIKFDLSNKIATVKLYKSGRAITIGQACVIYIGTRMIGGGFIKKIIV